MEIRERSINRMATFSREDEATWYVTNFNAASEDILGLVGRTPNLRLHEAAPQWQS